MLSHNGSFIARVAILPRRSLSSIAVGRPTIRDSGENISIRLSRRDNKPLHLPSCGATVSCDSSFVGPCTRASASLRNHWFLYETTSFLIDDDSRNWDVLCDS